MMQGKNKTSILLCLILLTGFFLRVQLAKDTYLHKWDERYHGLVAKNMLDDPFKPTLYKQAPLPYDYKDWSSNHVWLHKQPLPLWLISISYKLFGVSEFNTRLPSIFLSVLAVFILYLLAKRMFNEQVALLSAFFLSINGLVVEITSGRIATDHYDTLFMVFILIAIFFAQQHANTQRTGLLILSGVFIGFAVLTKWLPALIVLPLHFLFLKQEKVATKTALLSVFVSLAISVIVFLPWQIFIFRTYPLEARWEYLHNWLHIVKPLDGQTGNGFYFLDKIRINYSEIIYLPLIYLIYRTAKSKPFNYKLFALSLWIFIPLIFFSLAKTKMQAYVLFISPALFIITSKLFFDLLAFQKIVKHKVLRAFGYLLAVAIIFLPIRYCFERTQFGFKKDASPDYLVKYQQLKDSLPEKCVVLNVSEPINFMFYHNCSAYSQSEVDIQSKSELEQDGWTLRRYDEISNTLQPM